jgi:ankyrin repeat protein
MKGLALSKERKVHMSEQTPTSASGALSLPDNPNLEWLRKRAKLHLDELRQTKPDAKLAAAQLDLARQYGFSSWRALKSHIDSLTFDGELFEAAKKGDVHTLSRLLDASPEKVNVRNKPYEWSLLHVAAFEGRLAVVDLLLGRGLDVNTREKGDNTYAMHWAAAAGHLDVVRRLADAGGDVVGRGDDHGLEIIGWATCWEGCDDPTHRAIADFLVSRGTKHTILSAIALNLSDEVRRIVAADSSALAKPMSHNEDFQLPLHFAVRMNRPEMVALLLELGADPLGRDGTGYPAAAYATEPNIDRSVMEMLRARGTEDLVTALALGDWKVAARLLEETPGSIKPGGASAGALHLMSKRNNVAAVKWLIDHGADPSGRWDHWDAELTPLHLAVMQNHVDVVRLLLEAGADPTIHDSKHDSDPIGWASFFGRKEILQMLTARGTPGITSE